MQQQQQQQPRPCVPTGYRFTPTPEELIRFYLNPWVTTGHHLFPAGNNLFPSGIVCVADIYAADPDTLTSRFPDHGHDGVWYFLCVARWKGGKAGTRMSRCVQGGGTWHGSSKRKPVGNNEGYRQGFEYRAPGDQKTVWIMEELVTNLEAATDARGVKVICKVYHSPRAAPAAMVDGGVGGVEEEESSNNNNNNNNNNKVGVGGGSKRPSSSNNNLMTMVRDGQASSSSYIASTSHHQGGMMMMMSAAAGDAGIINKRARLLSDGAEHGLVPYSVSETAPPPPPPADYYAAGTSSQQESVQESWQQYLTEQQGAQESWQQYLTEQGAGVDGGEVAPPSVPAVETADDTENPLAVVPPMGYSSFDVADLSSWPPSEWVPSSDDFDFDATDAGVEEGGDEAKAAI